MKKITFTILGILFLHTAFSQANYQRGYIIQLNGDTLKGYIDYRSWDKNPDKINFQRILDGDKSGYRPEDIKMFGVKNDIYAGAIVKKEISPYKTNSLNNRKDFVFEMEPAFLQAIIIGEKSLYFYRDGFGHDNFYIRQGEQFELLEYKKYLQNEDGKSLIREVKRYRTQLIRYFDDCPNIQSKMQDLEYRRTRLEKLFKDYYGCSSSPIEFQQKREKVSFEFGVVAGVSLSTLKFRIKNLPVLDETDFSTSVDFSGGIFLDITLARNLKKWSFYNELLYTNYCIHGQYQAYQNEGNYEIVDMDFGYAYLKINNLIRYKYLIGKIHVFANAGISNGWVIDETDDFKSERKVGGLEKNETGRTLPFVRRHEQSYILGIGTSFKKLSFETRLEKGNGMSTFFDLGSFTTRYYFLLGYRF